MSPLKRTVGTWGNSLAVRLPKEMAKDLNLELGAPVEVRSNGKEIVITRAVGPYSLFDLVSKIAPANCHLEVATATAGSEVW